MKTVVVTFIILALSTLAHAESAQWILTSTATFKIEGRHNSGFKKLQVTALNNDSATVEETIFLGNQVKVCQHTVKIKNNHTESTACTGQIPIYTHFDFYPGNPAFYIRQEKPTLKLKVGTFKAICKTYRVGPATGQAFAVNCTSNEIPFWGEVATAVSDASGSTDIMYTELVEIN